MKLVASAIIVFIAITSSSAFSFSSIALPSVRVTIESGAFAAGLVKSVADAAGNVVHGISAGAAALANNTANLKAEIIAIVRSYKVDPSEITDAMESSASDAINSLIAFVNNIEFAVGMVASFEKQIGIQLRVNVAAYIAQITIKQGAAKCWDASKDALNQTSSDLAKQLNELAANESASLKAQLQGLDNAATTEIKLQLESGANNQCASATTSPDKQACYVAYVSLTRFSWKNLL